MSAVKAPLTDERLRQLCVNWLEQNIDLIVDDAMLDENLPPVDTPSQLLAYEARWNEVYDQTEQVIRSL